MLARTNNLSRGETRLAWAAALVHDIGRFPQFETYATFSDALSKNHGAMGVGVLVKQGIVKGLCIPENTCFCGLSHCTTVLASLMGLK